MAVNLTFLARGRDEVAAVQAVERCLGWRDEVTGYDTGETRVRRLGEDEKFYDNYLIAEELIGRTGERYPERALSLRVAADIYDGKVVGVCSFYNTITDGYSMPIDRSDVWVVSNVIVDLD